MRSNFEASIFNWKNSGENINTIYCSLDKFAYLGQAKICGINHKRGKSEESRIICISYRGQTLLILGKR